MGLFDQALKSLGFRRPEPAMAPLTHLEQMGQTLHRIRTAELIIREARSLEQLDCGRAALWSANAELQYLIRSAKRAQGITLREIPENEAIHNQMREHFRKQTKSKPRKLTGTDP